MYRPFRFAIVLLSLLLSVYPMLNPETSANESPVFLFLPSASPPNAKGINNPLIIRQRTTLVNTDALLRAGNATRLELNLFEDVSHQVIVQNLVRNQRGSLLLTGRVPGVENGRVILIMQRDALSGTIFLQNQVYQIRPTASNLHVVREIKKNDGAIAEGIVSGISPLDQKIIELVNKERLIEGLGPLHYNSKLSMAARNYAEDMALNNHFGHTRRDGRKFYQMIFETGYPVSVCGENLAVGFTAPEEVFEGWISSPGHRVNILNPAFTEIGVGHAIGVGIRNNRLHYWAQNFGGAGRTDLASSIGARPYPQHLSLSRLFSSNVLR